MALRPGTRVNSTTAAATAGRAAGFVVLGGLAMSVVAAVVLVPAYARLRTARYQQDYIATANANTEALIAANDRLITALPLDRVLTMRLAMTQQGLWPRNEVVVIDPAGDAPRPVGAATIARQQQPAPPPPWLVRAGYKLETPSIRRSLLLLAMGIMLVAIYMFAPPMMRPPIRETP